MGSAKTSFRWLDSVIRTIQVANLSRVNSHIFHMNIVHDHLVDSERKAEEDGSSPPLYSGYTNYEFDKRIFPDRPEFSVDFTELPPDAGVQVGGVILPRKRSRVYLDFYSDPIWRFNAEVFESEIADDPVGYRVKLMENGFEFEGNNALYLSAFKGSRKKARPHTELFHIFEGNLVVVCFPDDQVQQKIRENKDYLLAGTSKFEVMNPFDYEAHVACGWQEAFICRPEDYPTLFVE